MTESANEKSLAQIGYEAIIAAKAHAFLDPEWPTACVKAKEQAEIFAAAVEAAVLARHQQTTPVAELGEEDIQRLAEDAYTHATQTDELGWIPWEHRSHAGKLFFYELLRKALASRPTAPPYFVTKDRPPTEADFVGARVFGWSIGVESWLERRSITVMLEDAADPYWFSVPMPPAPPEISAEEKAFEDALEDQGIATLASQEDNRQRLRGIWDAARSYTKAA